MCFFRHILKLIFDYEGFFYFRYCRLLCGNTNWQHSASTILQAHNSIQDFNSDVHKCHAYCNSGTLAVSAISAVAYLGNSIDCLIHADFEHACDKMGSKTYHKSKRPH